MSTATTPSRIHAALIALAVLIVSLVAVSSASAAVNVHLRVEGATTTHFSGDVTTDAGSVQGATDRPECRSNLTPATFATPNAITAAASAVGAANVTTSGTHYGWGTMLCSVNGEFPADANGGWLVRINQQDSTAPNGYVTATDPLSNGDSVVLYMSPAYGHFNASLELRLPATAKPGVPVTGYVDSFSTANDAKTPGSGVAISGGGASATSAADGSFQLTFPSEGKFLVAANKASAIRGSQWVTVDDGIEPVPVVPQTQKQINKQRRIAARAKCRQSKAADAKFDLRGCIRTANRIGRTPTALQRRVDARAKCVANYPQRGTTSRVRCIRAANRIGR